MQAFAFDFDGAVVDAVGEVVEAVAPFAEQVGQFAGTCAGAGSPTVFMPSRCILCRVTLPTPGILPSGRSVKKASTFCGGRTNWPFGLFQSEAILAKNLFGATPAEAVRPGFGENVGADAAGDVAGVGDVLVVEGNVQ